MKIGYARVSSKGQNLDMQVNAFKAAGCEKIFVEKQSAFKERPELQKVFDTLRAGDELYVWALDRLGRTMLDILQKVKELNDKSVILKVTSLDIDTSTPSGKILIWSFGLLAELENDLRKQRQMEGIEAAKLKGRTGGRPPGLSDEAKKKAITAKKLYLSKEPVYSVREICKILQISSRTFYKYLEFMGVKKSSDNLDSIL